MDSIGGSGRIYHPPLQGDDAVSLSGQIQVVPGVNYFAGQSSGLTSLSLLQRTLIPVQIPPCYNTPSPVVMQLLQQQQQLAYQQQALMTCVQGLTVLANQLAGLQAACQSSALPSRPAGFDLLFQQPGLSTPVSLYQHPARLPPVISQYLQPYLNQMAQPLLSATASLTPYQPLAADYSGFLNQQMQRTHSQLLFNGCPLVGNNPFLQSAYGLGDILRYSQWLAGGSAQPIAPMTAYSYQVGQPALGAPSQNIYLTMTGGQRGTASDIVSQQVSGERLTQHPLWHSLAERLQPFVQATHINNASRKQDAPSPTVIHDIVKPADRHEDSQGPYVNDDRIRRPMMDDVNDPDNDQPDIPAKQPTPEKKSPDSDMAEGAHDKEKNLEIDVNNGKPVKASKVIEEQLGDEMEALDDTPSPIVEPKDKKDPEKKHQAEDTDEGKPQPPADKSPMADKTKVKPDQDVAEDSRERKPLPSDTEAERVIDEARQVEQEQQAQQETLTGLRQSIETLKTKARAKLRDWQQQQTLLNDELHPLRQQKEDLVIKAKGLTSAEGKQINNKIKEVEQALTKLDQQIARQNTDYQEAEKAFQALERQQTTVSKDTIGLEKLLQDYQSSAPLLEKRTLGDKSELTQVITLLKDVERQIDQQIRTEQQQQEKQEQLTQLKQAIEMLNNQAEDKLAQWRQQKTVFSNQFERLRKTKQTLEEKVDGLSPAGQLACKGAIQQAEKALSELDQWLTQQQMAFEKHENAYQALVQQEAGADNVEGLQKRVKGYQSLGLLAEDFRVPDVPDQEPLKMLLQEVAQQITEQQLKVELEQGEQKKELKQLQQTLEMFKTETSTKLHRWKKQQDVFSQSLAPLRKQLQALEEKAEQLTSSDSKANFSVRLKVLNQDLSKLDNQLQKQQANYQKEVVVGKARAKQAEKVFENAEELQKLVWDYRKSDLLSEHVSALNEFSLDLRDVDQQKGSLKAAEDDFKRALETQKRQEKFTTLKQSLDTLEAQAKEKLQQWEQQEEQCRAALRQLTAVKSGLNKKAGDLKAAYTKLDTAGRKACGASYDTSQKLIKAFNHTIQQLSQQLKVLEAGGKENRQLFEKTAKKEKDPNNNPESLQQIITDYKNLTSPKGKIPVSLDTKLLEQSLTSAGDDIKQYIGKTQRQESAELKQLKEETEAIRKRVQDKHNKWPMEKGDFKNKILLLKQQRKALSQRIETINGLSSAGKKFCDQEIKKLRADRDDFDKAINDLDNLIEKKEEQHWQNESVLMQFEQIEQSNRGDIKTLKQILANYKSLEQQSKPFQLKLPDLAKLERSVKEVEKKINQFSKQEKDKKHRLPKGMDNPLQKAIYQLQENQGDTRQGLQALFDSDLAAILAGSKHARVRGQMLDTEYMVPFIKAFREAIEQEKKPWAERRSGKHNAQKTHRLKAIDQVDAYIRKLDEKSPDYETNCQLACQILLRIREPGFVHQADTARCGGFSVMQHAWRLRPENITRVLLELHDQGQSEVEAMNGKTVLLTAPKNLLGSSEDRVDKLLVDALYTSSEGGSQAFEDAYRAYYFGIHSLAHEYKGGYDKADQYDGLALLQSLSAASASQYAIVLGVDNAMAIKIQETIAKDHRTQRKTERGKFPPLGQIGTNDPEKPGHAIISNGFAVKGDKVELKFYTWGRTFRYSVNKDEFLRHLAGSPVVLSGGRLPDGQFTKFSKPPYDDVFISGKNFIHIDCLGKREILEDDTIFQGLSGRQSYCFNNNGEKSVRTASENKEFIRLKDGSVILKGRDENIKEGVFEHFPDNKLGFVDKQDRFIPLEPNNSYTTGNGQSFYCWKDEDNLFHWRFAPDSYEFVALKGNNGAILRPKGKELEEGIFKRYPDKEYGFVNKNGDFILLQDNQVYRTSRGKEYYCWNDDGHVRWKEAPESFELVELQDKKGVAIRPKGQSEGFFNRWPDGGYGFVNERGDFTLAENNKIYTGSHGTQYYCWNDDGKWGSLKAKDSEEFVRLKGYHGVIMRKIGENEEGFYRRIPDQRICIVNREGDFILMEEGKPVKGFNDITYIVDENGKISRVST